MSDPIPTKSLLNKLVDDRQTCLEIGWSQYSSYCLSVRDLTTIIDALQIAAQITLMYEREIRNGFPVTNEEQKLVATMHAIIHTHTDTTDAT